MKQKKRTNDFLFRGIFWGLMFCCSACSAKPLEWAYENFDNGWWRIEGSTTTLGNQTFPERGDDFMMIGTLEYEWPVKDKMTFAIRGYPLLLYYQDSNKKRESDYIYGGGIGIGTRLYETIERTGFYGEFSVVPIFHTKEFEGNGSKFNFALHGGLGYQFNKNWATGFQYYHISNASLDKENMGIDVFLLALSYRW